MLTDYARTDRVRRDAFAGCEEVRVDAAVQRKRRLELERRALHAAATLHGALRELMEFETNHPEPEPLAGLIHRFGRK